MISGLSRNNPWMRKTSGTSHTAPNVAASRVLHWMRNEQSRSFVHWLQTEAPRPDGARVARAAPARRRRRHRRRLRAGPVHPRVPPHPRDAHRPRAGRRGRRPRPRRTGGVRGLGGRRHVPHRPPPLHRRRQLHRRGRAPFEIPLGALVPVATRNLLPAAKNIGTTHITNGAYGCTPWNGTSANRPGSSRRSASTAPHARGRPREARARVRRFQAVLVEAGIEIHWPEIIGY